MPRSLCKRNFLCPNKTAHTSGACMPKITDLQREILLNKEVIAVNQEPTPQGQPLAESARGDSCSTPAVWSRRLSNGDLAVALYNCNDKPQDIGFSLDRLGWGDSATKATVRDLWAHKNLAQIVGEFNPVEVAPHATIMLRLSKN